MRWTQGWIIALLLSSTVLAGEGPVFFVNTIAEQMIQDLKQQKPQLKSNPDLIKSIVNRRLLPHVDITSMSRLAIGNNGWRQATPEQRKQFRAAFSQLIINTYSGVLQDYRDETIRLKPFRRELNQKKYLTVHSEIIRTRGPNILVSYNLIIRKNQWKIYDMNVEGVGIVRSFRNQFANELRKNGFNGLIRFIVKHNQKQT